MSIETTAALEELKSIGETVVTLEHVNERLYWDEQVMMPEGGTPARSKQKSTISSLKHERLADERTAELLETASENELDPVDAALVRELQWEHDRASRVPDEIVTERATVTSEAQPVWRKAKAEDDFSQFEDSLEQIFDVSKRYADHVEPNADRVEALFRETEPHFSFERMEEILAELRTELVPLIEDIQASDVEVDQELFTGSFPEEKQYALAHDILDTVGYDWEHGRLDTAPHPFAGGTPYDSRITTKFDESNLLSAIPTTLHEFGHALYSLGLPRDRYDSPVGLAQHHAVHESQSRFWENHVSRSRPFWELVLPLIRDHFDGFDDVTPEDAYKSANTVYEDNPLRTEADELTYHMHIILRFEIERALLTEELSVSEVPSVWSEKLEEYLGVVPESTGQGPLQDIHWSMGAIVNFQNYTLGSVLAAQLDATMCEEIDDVENKIARGEFSDIRDWLTTNVHQCGRLHTTDELIVEATGEELTAEYFIEHVTKKYSSIYDL
ncbi:carboxypeptidase M32 [Natronosalvus halobius]|uniref:carboxypeptidase M32 n=1 Tax=Natronosalvus halobius TaxID=2953746 RepID=UPI0020A1AFCB|nr:carboxypeptidase M32 [Natronosalvus halobius]USZ73679.1 carboxypeptidase M32 [Natronosalvus halobius]